MDPAFANVLRRTPSNGSYTSSPLRQAVLGRSARGGAVGRRKRGGVPFKEARPPSIVDAPEVLAAELGGLEESPLKPFNTSLLNDTEIIEEDDDDVEYIRVKKVEKVEFGCQTEFVEDEKTVVLAAPPITAPVEPEPVPVPVLPPVVHVEVGIQSDAEPEPIAPPPIVPPPPPVVRTEIGIQSEPEPEPVLPPKPDMAEMSLQTDPEPVVVVVEKVELGVQHDAPEPVRPSTACTCREQRWNRSAFPSRSCPSTSGSRKKPAAFGHYRYWAQGHYHAGRCLAHEQQCGRHDYYPHVPGCSRG